MANFDRADTSNKIIAIIVEKLNTDKDKVSETATLEDLGVDSLDMVEFVLKLEEVFAIEINDEDAEKFNNVGHIVDYVHKLRTK